MWILAHRGVLTQIASEHSVSHQFVRRIAYSEAEARSRDLRVERALKAMGCPGVKVG